MTEQVLPQVSLSGSVTGLDPTRALEHALVTYHAGVRSDLEQRVLVGPLDLTADVLAGILMEVASGHLNVFRVMAGVAFRLAAKNARSAQHLPSAPMSEAAHLSDEEALNLGAYLAAQDANAVMEGYHVALNAKVPAKEAARRSVRAFGLTAPQMRTSFKIKDEGVDSDRPGAYHSRITAFIERATRQRHFLLARDAIAKIEADAIQSGREAAQARGEVSPTARKRWYTAADERTCPVCAPMDQGEVLLSEPFLLPDGNRVQHPPVHPRCRCVTELIEDDEDTIEDVAKARWAERQHPRDARGEFRTKTQEAPVVDEGDSGDVIERLMAQVGIAANALRNPGLSTESPHQAFLAPAPGIAAQPGLRAGGIAAQPALGAQGIGAPGALQAPAAPSGQIMMAGQLVNVAHLNLGRQLKIAGTVEGNERHQAQGALPEGIQPTPPGLIAFAADLDLGLTHFHAQADQGNAQVDAPLHFVDRNDTLAVAGAINAAMQGMDTHLREYPPAADFADLQASHDPGLTKATSDLRTAILAHSRPVKGDLRIEVSPEDAREAWRHVLSPTGSGYKSHYLMEAIDADGNTVASTMVPSETVVAFTNLAPDFLWLPRAVIAPHGTWKSGSMAGSTEELVPGGVERRVTGAFKFKHEHGVIVITPDLGVLPRATPEN